MPRGRPRKSGAESTGADTGTKPAALGARSGANVGIEQELWQATDKLRNNMDAAEHKHVVLGLTFLKYIADAFHEPRAALEADKKSGDDAEDPDEHRSESVCWVPKDARWSSLPEAAKQPTIGRHLDDAMAAIERDNPTLKGVLPKDFPRAALDKQRLGELIGTIGLGAKAKRSRDVLGRVYVHGVRVGDVAIYGQKSNHITWRIGKHNPAIGGIDANFASNESSSFQQDGHKALNADYEIASSRLNDSDWGGDLLKNDPRWVYGTSPAGNAHYASVRER
jgi:type I restriction enzyme M protein